VSDEFVGVWHLIFVGGLTAWTPSWSRIILLLKLWERQQYDLSKRRGSLAHRRSVTSQNTEILIYVSVKYE